MLERVFKTLSFTIARKWKQFRCPSTDKWIRKTWYMHTIKYYLAVENSKIMNFGSSWVEELIYILILCNILI